jgi:hypothetical protein
MSDIFLRVISLYLDITKPGGVQPLLSGKSSTEISATPSFILGDKFTLALYFRNPSAGITTASTPIEISGAIALGAKATADLDATEFLFSASGFAETGADDDLRYEAALDLNTKELIAAMGTDDTLDVTVDIEVQDAGNTERLTFQFAAQIRRQALIGTEAGPTSAPSLFEYYTDGDGLHCLRIKNDLGETLQILKPIGA